MLNSNLFHTFFLLCFFSLATAQDISQKEFSKSLGNRESKALDLTVESFIDFLEINFPEYESSVKRKEAFLSYISEHSSIDPKWLIDSIEAKMLYQKWESSGLRIEVYIYGYEMENYKPKCNISEFLVKDSSDTLSKLGELQFEPEDTIVDSHFKEWLNYELIASNERFRVQMHTNRSGAFLCALISTSSGNRLVVNYVNAKLAADNLSPAFVASGILNSADLKNEYFLDRILVVEYYFWLLKSINKEYNVR